MAWISDGDPAALGDLRAALADEPVYEEILEALDELESMETETADEQPATRARTTSSRVS